MPSLPRQLGALLVLAHLVGISATAMPAPHDMITELKPRQRRALLGWTAPIRGLWASEDALVEDFVAANNTLTARRAALLGPVFRWQDHTGTTQGWAMFGQINPHGGRLQIHIRTGEGEWVPLFQDHDEGDWRSALLNHERVRGVRAAYSRRVRNRRPQYRRLARWLARHAAADFPQATEFRIRYQRVEPARPEELRERGGRELGEVDWEEIIDLEALR